MKRSVLSLGLVAFSCLMSAPSWAFICHYNLSVTNNSGSNVAIYVTDRDRFH